MLVEQVDIGSVEVATTEDAIAEVLAEHVRAVNSTNVELLLGGMTDDLVYVGQGMAAIRGKDEMRQFITPIYADASIDITMYPTSLEVLGDRAIEWGTVRGTLALGERNAESVSLTYLFVYRCGDDGRWRISHDISTEGPAADS